MSGNVWEWVEDNFQQYKPGQLTDPLVHVNDTLAHSVRGGSFTDRQNKCRTSSRDGNWPDYKQTNLGFRLAMDE
jgi:formylglycine-generating enzyme required for sulfatase activity